MILSLLLIILLLSSPLEAQTQPQTRHFELDQIDYRHRASFSIGIPGFARIRLRPSYEYRFRPISPQKAPLKPHRPSLPTRAPEDPLDYYHYWTDQND